MKFRGLKQEIAPRVCGHHQTPFSSILQGGKVMSGFLRPQRDLKKKILDGTIEVFRKKGASFTMSDISKELGISKKTIYVQFDDKKSLLLELVDYFFDSLKENENRIWEDDTLDTKEKFTKILGAMPEASVDMDFASLYEMRGKYPEVDEKVRRRLESDWEKTLELLRQGKKEGIFKDVNETVFQITFEATLERFLNGDELSRNHVKYGDALRELVDMLVGGISR
jgi:AcrR family transcriptional regulator